MHKKHMLLMLLCCLIPMAGLAAGLILGVALNSILYFGMFLLCPLMHLVLMKMMMGRHDDKPKRFPMAQIATDHDAVP